MSNLISVIIREYLARDKNDLLYLGICLGNSVSPVTLKGLPLKDNGFISINAIFFIMKDHIQN